MNDSVSFKCIMIIAGEASGDLHGANLVRAMRRKYSNLFFFGIGGDALRQAGVRVLVDSASLSVVGITEVVAKIPQILKGFSAATDMMKALRPDLLILIDFPDFNLKVAKTAKKTGIPVLYYISPQIWAWRPGRVKTIAKRIDHMAVILPFEADFYQKHQVPVTFVGHPLLDIEPDGYVYDSNHGPSSIPTLGLLPGSREGEIVRHLPVMLQSAVRLQKTMKHIRFIVSMAPGIHREFLDQICAPFSDQLSLEIDDREVGSVFNRCDMVVAVSGTVTLQAAIHGKPMIIIYRVSPVSYWLGRALIQVNHIGLINLVAGESIVPELIQEKASPETISAISHRLLTHPEERESIRRKLLKAKTILGGPGASGRVADIAFDLLKCQA
jgi:lipid-A-disaccharide synthase